MVAPPVTIVASDHLTSPWFDRDCHASCRRTQVLEWRFRQSHLPADQLARSAVTEEKRALFVFQAKSTRTASYLAALTIIGYLGAVSIPFYCALKRHPSPAATQSLLRHSDFFTTRQPKCVLQLNCIHLPPL